MNYQWNRNQIKESEPGKGTTVRMKKKMEVGAWIDRED